MDPAPTPNNPTPDQAFFAKNYDENAPTANLAVSSALPQTHPHRSLQGASSYSLATVERALAEIEGSNTLERCAGAPTSPILGSEPSTSRHEASPNFLKRSPDTEDRAASPGVSLGACTMAVANASPIVVGRQRRGRRVGVLGAWQVRVGVCRRILMRVV